MVKVNAIKTSVIGLMSCIQKNYETYKSVRLKKHGFVVQNENSKDVGRHASMEPEEKK